MKSKIAGISLCLCLTTGFAFTPAAVTRQLKKTDVKEESVKVAERFLSFSESVIMVDGKPVEKYPGLAKVLAYLRTAFPLTIREEKEDRDGSIGLPYPHTVPCAKETFRNLYYWDTYFINLGLLNLGMAAQAKYNTDDQLFLVDKLGYMPNSNNCADTNRSQPPLLSWMVRDIFAETKDRAWLRGAYATLAKEHDFWMTRRMSPTGLNRYGHSATPEYLKMFYDYLAKDRFPGLNCTGLSSQLAFSSHSMCEAESGWDFNPRFDRRCSDFCPVDLNAILYLDETIMADFAKVLSNGEESNWRKQAGKRKQLMQKYLWNDAIGYYTDYDFVNKKKSDWVSCAALFPLLAGMATPEQAELVAKKMRESLEYDHGMTTCEKRPHPFVYQADYPNAWPPMQCIAIKALDRYGFKDDARRIAEKYVRMVIANYEKTGDLWEKYNAVTGTLDVVDEYKMPRMVGWTAGSFVFAAEYLSIQPDN